MQGFFGTYIIPDGVVDTRAGGTLEVETQADDVTFVCVCARVYA